jgi:hypothetical protein
VDLTTKLFLHDFERNDPSVAGMTIAVSVSTSRAENMLRQTGAQDAVSSIEVFE